ncbi:MAG: hypothetical protein U5K43_12630 [Halofilum sp. (in: g-proteobacteria)]|nr:hypothetical protein [Halofilum sp. (in: g-proteobacteria)]
MYGRCGWRASWAICCDFSLPKTLRFSDSHFCCSRWISSLMLTSVVVRAEVAQLLDLGLELGDGLLEIQEVGIHAVVPRSVAEQARGYDTGHGAHADPMSGACAAAPSGRSHPRRAGQWPPAGR